MTKMTSSRADSRIDLSLRKIQPAYRQIADQMSELIIGGSLLPGEQLPTEEGLAARFGVSRNTVREALRMLSSQGLVATTRGVTGGTFVASPDAGAIQSSFETNLGLLSGASGLDKQELFEIRSILEIPAARWAAERRTGGDLDRLRVAAADVAGGQDRVVRTYKSSGFHEAVLDAAGNRLLSMITPPVWRVFRRLSEAEGADHDAWPDLDHDHTVILDFIEQQNPDAAAEAMRVHLFRLRDTNN